MSIETLLLLAGPRRWAPIALTLLCWGCGSVSTQAQPNPGQPTAIISCVPRAVLPGGTLVATISFDRDVIDMVAGDLTVTGGVPGIFTAMDARTYTMTITAGGAGTTTVDVSLAAGAAQSLAGQVSLSAVGQGAVAHAPWASASGSDGVGIWADLTVDGHGEHAVQRFRLIPPGSFVMGSPPAEPGREPFLPNSERQHVVAITQPYWMADTECTQRMWKAVLGTAPSHFIVGGLDLPVEQISYALTDDLLSELNEVHPNLLARLPTEAEWEYAARSGSTAPFSVTPLTVGTVNCLPSLDDPYIAIGVFRDEPVVVKSLPPNLWGLYEMHGNLMEMCSDHWQTDLGSLPVQDPIGPGSGIFRVVRGGSYANPAALLRSGFRHGYDPSGGAANVGMRLVAPGWPAGAG